jgi:TPR repeat protein
MKDARTSSWVAAFLRILGFGSGLARAGDAPLTLSDKVDLRRVMARARSGDVDAQKAAASAYLRGEGVPANAAEGVRWLNIAANAGDVEAQSNLATILFRGVAEPKRGSAFGAGVVHADPKTARELALRAAEEGQVEAQALLGFMLCIGEGGEQDYQQAVHWYGRAVTGGSLQAALGLAMIRLLGLDGVTDTELAVRLISRAAEGKIATAIYVQGTLYEAGVSPIVANEAVALRLYQQAAEAGVRPAKARLGLALMNGWGAPRDTTAGETWLRRAAIEGDGEAAAIVGDLQCSEHHGAPNFLEAMQWYQIAAERGHNLAARKLGLMHLAGRGAQSDPDSAMYWLERAAEAGDLIALIDLGEFAVSKPDAAKAMGSVLPRLRELAEAGDPVAAFNLAVCLHNGWGVDRDLLVAREWLRVAAPHVVNAAYWLGRSYMEGTLDEPDPGAALPWVRRAADEGMPDAIALLGDMVLKGKGVPADENAALILFERAGEAGHAGAAFACGALLGGGHGVKQDRVRAQAWFRRSAEAGHQHAQNMLGRYLLHGLAGETDPEQARFWLERANSTAN